MTNGELLGSWFADPIVIAFGVAAAVAYGAARRGRFTSRGWFFGAALLVFAVSLLSPIALLAKGFLFSAHMLQHLLLLMVVPPLALLALAPQQASTARSKWRIAPVVAWGMGVGAMWIWHAPVMCNAAARSVWVSHLQTLSLLGMGTAYWWPILAPNREHRLEPLPAILYLFGACIACTILGVIVTFSPVAVCNAFAHPMDSNGALALIRDGWGMTAKSDQEVGGLMMWVPTCVIYTSAILGMLARYYGERTPVRRAGEEATS